MLSCKGFLSEYTMFYREAMQTYWAVHTVFMWYRACKTKHKRCGHGRESMLSFLFTTVGNSLTGNSWDCLSNWFECAFSLLLDHHAGYVNELSMEDDEYRFFFLISLGFSYGVMMIKSIFTRKGAVVFTTAILLWWWIALLDSLIYTEQDELGKVFVL